MCRRALDGYVALPDASLTRTPSSSVSDSLTVDARGGTRRPRGHRPRSRPRHGGRADGRGSRRRLSTARADVRVPRPPASYGLIVVLEAAPAVLRRRSATTLRSITLHAATTTSASAPASAVRYRQDGLSTPSASVAWPHELLDQRHQATPCVRRLAVTLAKHRWGTDLTAPPRPDTHPLPRRHRRSRRHQRRRADGEQLRADRLHPLPAPRRRTGESIVLARPAFPEP